MCLARDADSLGPRSNHSFQARNKRACRLRDTLRQRQRRMKLTGIGEIGCRPMLE
jgi:hypothetical protein